MRRRTLGDLLPACAARLTVGGGLARKSTRAAPVAHDPEALAARVVAIIAPRFPGSTITTGRGRWLGKSEPALIVDLVMPADSAGTCFPFKRNIEHAARVIRTRLQQQAVGVLVTTPAAGVEVDFVAYKTKRWPLTPRAAARAKARRTGP